MNQRFEYEAKGRNGSNCAKIEPNKGQTCTKNE